MSGPVTQVDNSPPDRGSIVVHTADPIDLGQIVQNNNDPDIFGETNWDELFEKMKANRGIDIDIQQSPNEP